MNLYEIDKEIRNCVDNETGEILDFDAFQNLKIEQNEKIENIALWIKNLLSDAKAINEEKTVLIEREKAAKKKAEDLKKYLDIFLNGQKFSTPRVSISYRKSNAVEVDDGFIGWAKLNAKELLNYSEPEVNKTAIKDYINNGSILENARIIEKYNLQIK